MLIVKALHGAEYTPIPRVKKMSSGDGNVMCN
jgi:hypothetical protein